MADRNLLLVKAEATYGLDPVAAAADTIWAENPTFVPDGQKVTGNVAKPGLSPIPGFVYGQYGTLEFDVPLAASGTAGTAPKWGPMAKACAWSETVVAVTSVTYALLTDTSAATSVSIIWREGRRKHQLSGARGVMSLKAVAGQRPMLHFKFKGIITPVITAAALVQADATWTGWNDAAPIAQGRTTFTFAGAQVPLWDLSFDQNDTVLFRDLPNQKNVQIIGERTFTGKVKAGVPLPSALNLETNWINGVVATYAVVHEAVGGKIVTLNGRFQNLKPAYVDEAGEDCFTCDLEHKASAINTDDDLSIVLT